MSLYNTISRNLFLPIGDFVLGRSVKKYLDFVEKSQWRSPEQIKVFQDHRIRCLVHHAYENVPYYNELFNERGLSPNDIVTCEDLEKLPLLTKKTVRENISKMVARNIPKTKMVNRMSSGSTGEPLQFYLSKDAYSFAIATYIRAWSWAGYSLGDKFIKISVNPRFEINKKIQDVLLRTYYFPSKSVTEKDIINFLSFCTSCQPKFIRGYPSTLSIVAEYMQGKGVSGINPKAVLTTGEILFPHMKESIENQFNCPVFDGYNGEGIAAHSECEKHEGYHIASDYGYIELVNKNGNRLNGGRGEIVGTDLWNYAVPFIRYNSKDIGVLGNKTCSCGRGLPTMERIEGRDVDILTMPSGKKLIVHFFTGYFGKNTAVDQYQVVQTKPATIIVKLVPNKNYNRAEENKIIKDIQDYVGHDVEVEREVVDDIPVAKSGKRRFVFRDFNN